MLSSVMVWKQTYESVQILHIFEKSYKRSESQTKFELVHH